MQKICGSSNFQRMLGPLLFSYFYTFPLLVTLFHLIATHALSSKVRNVLKVVSNHNHEALRFSELLRDVRPKLPVFLGSVPTHSLLKHMFQVRDLRLQWFAFNWFELESNYFQSLKPLFQSVQWVPKFGAMTMMLSKWRSEDEVRSESCPVKAM